MLDVRRRWSPSHSALAVAVTFLVLGIQVGVSRLLLYGSLSGDAPEWLIRAAGIASLLTPFGGPIPELPGPGWMRLWQSVWLVTGSLAGAFYLTLPAFLATSVAGEREQGRLSEVALTRMKPVEILAARGLSAALPFLVLSLAFTLVELVEIPLVRLPLAERIEVPEAFQDVILGSSSMSPQYLVWSMYVSAAASPVTLLLRVGVLACLSALATSVRVALLFCFGWVLVERCLFAFGISRVLAVLIPAEPGLTKILTTLLSLGLEAGTLTILLPYAARAVKYSTVPPEEPDSSGGS